MSEKLLDKRIRRTMVEIDKEEEDDPGRARRIAEGAIRRIEAGDYPQDSVEEDKGTVFVNRGTQGPLTPDQVEASDYDAFQKHVSRIPGAIPPAEAIESEAARDRLRQQHQRTPSSVVNRHDHGVDHGGEH